MAENKVLYNLKKVHYSVITVGGDGALQYAKPKALPGAVNFTLEVEQNSEKFYADGGVYFVASSAASYKGEIEIANITTEFEKEVLGMMVDSKNVMSEDLSVRPKAVALLFEVDGDVKNTRFLLANVQFSKPKLEYKTNTDKTEVTTVKMSYDGLQDDKGKGRYKTIENTDETVYNDWFTTVYRPEV